MYEPGDTYLESRLETNEGLTNYDARATVRELKRV